MTSELQRVARAVASLADPGSRLRAEAEAARAAARTLQAQVRGERDAHAVAERLRAAQAHAEQAASHLEMFGADAEAFGRSLAGGEGARAAFDAHRSRRVADVRARTNQMVAKAVTVSAIKVLGPSVAGEGIGQLLDDDLVGEGVERAGDVAREAWEIGPRVIVTDAARTLTDAFNAARSRGSRR